MPRHSQAATGFRARKSTVHPPSSRCSASRRSSSRSITASVVEPPAGVVGSARRSRAGAGPRPRCRPRPASSPSAGMRSATLASTASARARSGTASRKSTPLLHRVGVTVRELAGVLPAVVGRAVQPGMGRARGDGRPPRCPAVISSEDGGASSIVSNHGARGQSLAAGSTNGTPPSGCVTVCSQSSAPVASGRRRPRRRAAPRGRGSRTRAGSRGCARRARGGRCHRRWLR